MADVESILTTHYEAVREEEMERIRLRDQYLVWYATVSAGIAGIYVQDTKWWGLVATVPALTVVAGLLYAHTDVTLGALSHWLRHTYSKTLEDYRRCGGITYDLPHWDGSQVHLDYVRGIGFAMRYLCVALFLAGAGGLATKTVWANTERAFRVVMMVLVLIGATAPLWAWRERIRTA